MVKTCILHISQPFLNRFECFFFWSTRQIKHPIFTGQGAGQLSHTPGMTRAIA